MAVDLETLPKSQEILHFFPEKVWEMIECLESGDFNHFRILRNVDAITSLPTKSIFRGKLAVSFREGISSTNKNRGS